MAKIKLTKNELKHQKDALKRYNRYLPTLMLKKQQLQMEIRRIRALENEIKAKIDVIRNNMNGWISLFAEDVSLEKLVSINRIKREVGNIAGIDIPIFVGVDFSEHSYDLFLKPLWIDRAIAVIKQLLSLDVEIRVLEEQIRQIDRELRITNQRVNLFEKVKIPEARENIRRIRIYLGDEQTAAVVRGKIAKNKIVEVSD